MIFESTAVTPTDGATSIGTTSAVDVESTTAETTSNIGSSTESSTESPELSTTPHTTIQSEETSSGNLIHNIIFPLTFVVFEDP